MTRRTTWRADARLVGAALLAAACAPAATVPTVDAPTTQRVTTIDMPPAPGPLRPYALPRPEEFQLANGLRVVVVPQSSMPVVAARLLVDAGAQYEPAERAGLAVLTAALLAEGTRTLTGPRLAEQMERFGTQLQTGASHDAAFVAFTALSGAFPEALRLAAATVLEPALPEADFERLRQQALAAYAQSLATVQGLASMAFNRAVFAPEAPYGRRAAGTAETLQALTREDAVNWHGSMYAPSRTTLLLVGDVTVADARRLAEDVFGAWAVTAPATPRMPSRSRPLDGARVILLDRPGSVQSALMIGQSVIGAEDPDFFRMTALAHVLGGGFNSRINQNLRERRGWTYGAFAPFVAQRGVGTFYISSTVQTPATDSAIAESVLEYRRIVEEMVPEQELRAALNNIVGSFPASVLTVQGLAQRMQTVLLHDLPLDWYASYRERLASVQPDDVSAFGREHIRPGTLTIVVAGDLSVIEEPIRALDLGAVEVWNQEGERVR
jgi:zinc protease